MATPANSEHRERIERLAAVLRSTEGPVRLSKHTSNLFRPRERVDRVQLDATGLGHVLSIDAAGRIPDVEGMSEHESRKRDLNARRYSDSLEFVRNKFEDPSNVEIVRGLLADTLVAVDGRKIAYLSVDLNNAPSEQAVNQRLWPQLVPGALVAMDDDSFKGHQAQYGMWNALAARHRCRSPRCRPDRDCS